MSESVPPILRDLPTEIVGERVLLRPYRPGDGEAIWQAIDESRESLRPWLPWVDATKSAADSEMAARRAAGRWLLREDLTVGVWERTIGTLLGGSGLHRMNWDIPSFEIGYWLRTSAEGKGYMTEAVRLLCRLTFETLGANRVEIKCDAKNERSAAIPRRLGFVHEATLRNHDRDVSGELRDTLIFAMTPADYARLNNAP